MSMEIRVHSVSALDDVQQGVVPHHGRPLATDAPAGSAGQVERSWSEILEATTRLVSRDASTVLSAKADSSAQLKNMTELLRLQREVSAYQLRIECASKVCESFTTSLRKLQQQQ